MGSLGRKIRIEEAFEEYYKLKELLIPDHCSFDIDNISLSGSIRRGKRIDIGDIDILVTTTTGVFSNDLSKFLENNGYDIDASGSKIIRMINKKSGIQIDLFSTDENHFYPMMSYLTGPSEYNIGMRVVARKKGYKLNQNSIVELGTGNELIVKSEEALFNLLGCKYINPEDRINFYDSCKFNKI